MNRLRLTEFLLLLLATATFTAGFALLALAETGSITWRDLQPAWLLAGALLVAHGVLIWRQGSASDQVVLPLAGLLTGLGLVLAHRLAPALASRQTNWALLGIAVTTIVAGVPWPMRWLRRYRYTWAFLGLTLVALTLLFGVRPSGAGPRLWLGVGPFLFQPSELLKVLLVIFLASYLAEHQELVAFASLRIGRLRLPPLPYLGPILVIWGLSMTLLVWQRDLGAALIFFGIFLAMLYVASNRWTYVAGSLGLFLAGAIVIVQNFPHVQERVAIWLDPWPQAGEGSYQVVQALIAAASGGVLGPGLGYGFPTYIPAVHTDFVFVATAEEMGLAGALALIGLYMLLVYRGFHIALRADDAFTHLLAVGLTSIFGLQTLTILAGNLKLIPLTGVTLPFVSYGGSSLVTSSLMVGLLLRLRISDFGFRTWGYGREIRNPQSAIRNGIFRLATALFLGFLLVAATIPYWGVFRAGELTARADNPRLIEAERRLDRGRILDRNGKVLARTALDDEDIAYRRYSYPQLAPVLGYWSLKHGTAGIEHAFNGPLRAQPMGFQASLDQWLYHRLPVGNDVVLTIDLELQRVADTALSDTRGAVVLMDAQSGAILALASHPTFDPARIDEDFTQLKDDPGRPFLNRATQGRYPPGSAFKTVTLAAALQEGIVRPGQMFDDGDETLYVEGFPIRCANNPRGVDQFDLAHAYAYSCNLTFARMGLDLGTKDFKDYAGRFRIGREIPLEVRTAPSQLAIDPLLMNQVLLASTAFGQGELLVTPLNMALVAATVANAGIMPQPYLAEQIQTRDGKPVPISNFEFRISDFSSAIRNTQYAIRNRRGILGVPITEVTARRVRDIMITSVQDGYARRAQIPGAAVGGKTGTAQLGGENTEPHAWFIGWAQKAGDPDAPTYAIAVLVENGGEGSLVATPIAQQILHAAVSTDRPGSE
ncbi:MAG: FtsW/RodA/SpoVE family cell cycle protein [Anaerolineae bacterium]